MKKLFLHLPKCAGASVKKLLDDHCSDPLAYDYDDNFFRIPRPERNPVLMKALFEPPSMADGKIIFGHFFPIKYIGARRDVNIKLVTILRNPISRLISHYHFYKQGNFPEHYLWRKMLDDRWTFEDFAFSEEMRNYYGQFLIGIGLSNFDYIGISENMRESVLECFSTLCIELPTYFQIPTENVTNRSETVNISEDVARALRQRHADDFLIYEFAKCKFHASSKGEA